MQKRNSKKLHNLRYVLLLSLSVVQLFFAQDTKKNGTAGFTFLEIPATARTAALGEASLSLTDGNSSSMFDNPATLGFTSLQHSFAASYAPWFADIKNYASSYSYKTEFGVLGVGFILFDYGSIPRTVVASGQKVFEVAGTYNAHSLAAGISYSKMLTDRFSFGGTLKFVQEKIDVFTASNVVLDVGVLYFTGLGSFRIAGVIQNFGMNAKFVNDEFKMPAVFKLGAAVELWGEPDSGNRMTLLAGALHPNDSDEKVVAGAEYAWMDLLFLRAGYKFFFDEESYSFGIGIHPPVEFPGMIDFAYSDYGRLGRISRLTVQIGLR